MNFISISPHFPPNYYHFCIQLRSLGVNVLVIGDAWFDNLRQELKSGLTEYYRINNSQNYDDLVRAVGYFTYRYGKIDRLESHNEFWLETDARLRSDFNIQGFHTGDLPAIKRKSEMKKMFVKAGIRVARGEVLRTLVEVEAFAREAGYPIIAKPDSGVGASKTYKLHSDTELQAFFADKPAEDTIFEEFITGTIQTFDGLTDQNGQIVFASSLLYNEGMMDLVNDHLDFWYYTLRTVPDDLETLGRRLVEVYGLKERFFHFEFFRTPDGSLVGLEVNMRPPGGLTTDMFDYANDINIYREYANVVVNNRFESRYTRPYFCAYIGRRFNKPYTHSHNEILSRFPGKIMHHEQIPGVFSAALGDYGYLARSPELEEIQSIAKWVLEKQS